MDVSSESNALGGVFGPNRPVAGSGGDGSQTNKRVHGIRHVLATVLVNGGCLDKAEI
jgi:hypothetical protein